MQLTDLKKIKKKWMFLIASIVLFLFGGIFSNFSESLCSLFGIAAIVCLIVFFVINRKESDAKAIAEGRPTHAQIKAEKKKVKQEKKAERQEKEKARQEEIRNNTFICAKCHQRKDNRCKVVVGGTEICSDCANDRTLHI